MIFINVRVTWYLKRSENDQKRSKMDKNGQNTKNSVIKSTSNTKFEVHFSKNHCKHPFSMVSIDYYTYLIDTPKFFRNVPDPMNEEGNLLMDAPPHKNMDDLVCQAMDRARWRELTHSKMFDCLTVCMSI